MTFLPPRARLRSAGPLAVWLAVLALIPVFATSRAWAHEGHDHGAVPGVTAPALPRVVATSESYQFVGIVEGEALVIYLDRAADNAPVATAAVEVTIDSAVLRAVSQKNGTYELATPLLKVPGVHEVLVSITEGSTNDLLVGSITIPVAGTLGIPPHDVWHHLPAWLQWLLSSGGLVLGMAGVAFVLGMVMFSRRVWRTTPLGGVAILALAMTAAAPTNLVAHEGHDHGTPAAAGGNGPHRRLDGIIFLPKPTQRLLEVRTWIAKPETAVPSRRFAGRVIANPNRSGVVQSTIQGRYIAPAGGVPGIGTNVAAGELLGRVAPSFASIDASQIAQAMAELDQQIALARARLDRLEPLLQSRTVAVGQVNDARLTLDGLIKRRADLASAKALPEDLRSPVDGVIAGARVMSGQVVGPNDVVFQIIDPSSLMVEALVFGLGSQEKLAAATATLANGRAVKLGYVGRSRTLQQQYAQVQFEVLDVGDAMLDVGLPVKVVAETGAPVTGIILGRAALTQAPNGQTVVFRQKEPELFEPRPVRFEPFDAERVRILAGIEPGETIVVQGAPLVNQVR